MSSTCPHNDMANVGPLTAEIGSGLWHPSKFQRVSRLAFVTGATSLTRGQPNFAVCTMFGRLLGWYTIYIFSGALSLAKSCHVQNSVYVQVLRSPILAALLHGAPAVGISQTLRRGAHYGTFAEGATYIRLGGHHVGHRPTF